VNKHERAAQRKADLKQIAWLISFHIDQQDWFSAYENIKTYEYLVIRDEEFPADIAAYILYTDAGTHFTGLRSGVRAASRGRGYGVKLYKKLAAKARRQGKTYRTYSASTNIPSLNAHLKAGMKIERITLMEGDFISVHLTT